MTGSLARAAPVRFLIAVAIGWTAGRGIALVGWQPDATGLPTHHARTAVSAGAPHRRVPRWIGHRPDHWPIVIAALPAARPLPARAGAPAGAPRLVPRRPTRPDTPVFAAPPLLLAAYAPPPGDLRAGGLVEGRALIAPPRSASRMSGSAWAFLRGGGRASALSPVGQIGGGQMGARLLYTVDRTDHLALSARISRTIGGIDQTEAAVGIDWQPVAHIPVHLMAERRIAIDAGGRNAWTLGAAGGAYDVRLAPHWRLDGYAEAGVVGAHAHDLYADGALRVARAIDLGGGKSLALGGGAWGRRSRARRGSIWGPRRCCASPSRTTACPPRSTGANARWATPSRDRGSPSRWPPTSDPRRPSISHAVVAPAAPMR